MFLSLTPKVRYYIFPIFTTICRKEFSFAKFCKSFYLCLQMQYKKGAKNGTLNFFNKMSDFR